MQGILKRLLVVIGFIPYKISEVVIIIICSLILACYEWLYWIVTGKNSEALGSFYYITNKKITKFKKYMTS